jgi:hypothetical protein
MSSTDAASLPSRDRSIDLGPLPIVLRVIAVGFFLFFLGAAVVSASGTELPGILHDTFQWGHSRTPEEVMICSIYIVWAVCLWIAANDPPRYGLFLDFTIAANVAHALVMGVQGALIEGEQAHIYGDALVLGLVVLALALAWLPIRNQAARRHAAS